jgi:hypothetical protein
MDADVREELRTACRTLGMADGGDEAAGMLDEIAGEGRS